MKVIVFVALFAVAALAFNPQKPFQLGRHVRSVGDVVFTPAKLPCAYKIIVAAEITQQSSTMIADQVYNRANDLLLFNYSIRSSPGSMAYSYRFDLEQSGTVPVFEAYSGYYCTKNDEPTEDAKRDAYNQVAFFNEKQTYDGVDNTVFQGQNCKAYYTANDMEHIFVYVDDNDYIIGEYYYLNDKSMEALATVKYSFDVPMDVFALDRATFTGCDQKAYSVPPEQC